MYNPFNTNSNNTDEKTLPGNKQLYGIAAQYKNQLAGCKFKLVVYFDLKPNSEYYTSIEKQYMKHRRFIPSFDFKNGHAAKSITDHLTAYNNLIEYMLKNAKRITKVMLIENDYTNKLEKTFIVCNPNQMAFADFREPLFSAPDGNGNIYFQGIQGQYIRIDKMRQV